MKFILAESFITPLIGFWDRVQFKISNNPAGYSISIFEFPKSRNIGASIYKTSWDHSSWVSWTGTRPFKSLQIWKADIILKIYFIKAPDA